MIPIIYDLAEAARILGLSAVLPSIQASRSELRGHETSGQMGDDRGPDRSSDRVNVHRGAASGSAFALWVVEAQPIGTSTTIAARRLISPPMSWCSLSSSTPRVIIWSISLWDGPAGFDLP